MHAEDSTAIVQLCLDQSGQDSPAELIAQALCDRAVHLPHLRRGTLLHLSSLRLAHPAPNLNADETLSAIAERPGEAMGPIHPQTVRQFFPLANHVEN